MSVSPLVSVEWLSDTYQNSDVVVLDACWYMPDSGRDPRAEFEQRHIPGARFFDIDGVADTTSDLPHMLPDSDAFSEAVQALGINTDSHVIVYHKDLPSSARAWWTFRVFGHEKVSVLDGGMNAWLAANKPVTDAQTNIKPGNFTATKDHKQVASLHDILDFLHKPDEQILDVRPADRFTGQTPEPRPGMRSGHMPGAFNIPFPSFFDADTGRMKSEQELSELFEQAGIDIVKPITTSCGSGITACIATLALALLGQRNNRVYDGSWTEWGGRDDVPVTV